MDLLHLMHEVSPVAYIKITANL